MKIFEKLIRRTKHFVEDPEYMLGKLICRIIPNRYIPDKLYLKVLFRDSMGYKLDLRHPKTFNEKLQWLKLYDRNPLYTILVDKYRVKQWVADKIGEEYVIPTLAIYQSVDEIDLDKLPNQFVLKTTHDSGGVVICTDKNTFNIESAIAILNQSLQRDVYQEYKEWPYKNVKKQIIAETYMTDDSEENRGGLTDYKFSCYNGRAYKVMLCLNRASGHTKFYSFDKEWNLLRHNKMGKAAPDDFTIPKLAAMDQMFEIAEALSENMPFVRVDLYYVHSQIYFGEMTFYPMSGYDANILPETDDLYGSMIKLPID